VGATRYDRIGAGYVRTRRADPRIQARLHAAVGGARSVCNIGAGAGSYEPPGTVVAVEPAATMVAQRPLRAAPAVRAVAEALPLRTGSCDVALAVLTVHHWHDLEAGLAELRRVARRQVVFFFEPSWAHRLWLTADYFPEILDLATERAAPGEAELRRHLAVVSVEAVPVPADCTDGFGGAYWNRPEAYLDPTVRAGMSSFSQLDPVVEARGVERLAADLAAGDWDRKYGYLRERGAMDLGYRILVAVG
jgi:SAM-dependent methyltransferase